MILLASLACYALDVECCVCSGACYSSVLYVWVLDFAGAVVVSAGSYVMEFVSAYSLRRVWMLGSMIADADCVPHVDKMSAC